MSQAKEKIAAFKEKSGVFFEKVGTLTKVQRLAIVLVTFAAIGGIYYYFIFQPKQEQFKKAKTTYENQTKTLAIYKQKAAQLIKYEKKMLEAQGKFNQAMTELPDKRELPALLTQISQAGGKAGLVFHLFQPQNEISKEYYKELPISIKVEGGYHQLTDFFYQILQLNRIVNINNVDVKTTKGKDRLAMSCQAMTYMFVEKKEPQNKRKKRK